MDQCFSSPALNFPVIASPRPPTLAVRPCISWSSPQSISIDSSWQMRKSGRSIFSASDCLATGLVSVPLSQHFQPLRQLAVSRMPRSALEHALVPVAEEVPALQRT